ncbi:MAG: rhomboid family intramembrane serine protease [Pseudomonadota bacterium]
MHDTDPSPINALPAVVVVLSLAIFGVELIFMLARSGLLGATGGGEDWRIFALDRFAFSGEIFDWMLETGRYPLNHLQRFVTYPFVHFSFTQMIFVVVFVLALGKMVGEVLSQLAVVVIFFASAIVGALAYALLLDDPIDLAGGFPAAYGLIGGYTFILWVGYGAVGANQFRAFTLIGFLLGIQLVFGLLFNVGNAWVAEVAGFLTGLALSPLLVPGGLARLLARLRQR